MSNTIAELWYGNLEPVRYLGNGNTEIKRLERLMQVHLEQLEQALEDQELLKKYSDTVNKYLLLTNEQAFCDGFSLGTKITAEAMTEAEHLL